MILSHSSQIDSHDLLIELHDQTANAAVLEVTPVDASLLGSELRQQEHQIILDTLVSCNGKRKDVAEKLGISPRTLRYKLARMREDGIDLPA